MYKVVAKNADVKLYVDAPVFKLVDIPFVKPEWQTCRKIKALAYVAGSDSLHSPALAALDEWYQKDKDDFRKIIEGLRFLAEHKRFVVDGHHFRDSKHNPDVYEVRAYGGGEARLTFFLDGEDLVICAFPFDKDQGKDAQTELFSKTTRIMDLYFAYKKGQEK